MAGTGQHAHDLPDVWQLRQSLMARVGTTTFTWVGQKLGGFIRWWDVGATKRALTAAYTYNPNGTVLQLVETYYSDDGATEIYKLQYDYTYFSGQRVATELVTQLYP